MSEDQYSLTDWKDRFEGLQNEALAYGITSMVILSSEDPLSHQKAIHMAHRGSVIRLLGMMTHSWRTFNAKLFGP